MQYIVLKQLTSQKLLILQFQVLFDYECFIRVIAITGIIILQVKKKKGILNQSRGPQYTLKKALKQVGLVHDIISQ